MPQRRAQAYRDRSSPRGASIPRVDPFTVIFGGTLAFFVVFVLLLGLFSRRRRYRADPR